MYVCIYAKYIYTMKIVKREHNVCVKLELDKNI